MKRTSLLLALILVTSTIAEVSVGLDLTFNGGVDRNEQLQGGNAGTEQTHSVVSTGITPSLLFLVNDRLEVVPTAGFWFSRAKNIVEDADGTERVDYESTVHGFSGGCGLYVRVVEGAVLRLGLGPRIHARAGFNDNGSYYRMEIPLEFAVNTDFIVNDRFFIRMSPRIAAFQFVHEETDAQRTNSVDFLDIATMWLPTMGFYITF